MLLRTDYSFFFLSFFDDFFDDFLDDFFDDWSEVNIMLSLEFRLKICVYSGTN